MPEAVCRQTILRCDPFQHARCVGVPSLVVAHITICTGEDWLPSLGIKGRRDRDIGTKDGVRDRDKDRVGSIFIGKIGLRIGDGGTMGYEVGVGVGVGRWR